MAKTTKVTKTNNKSSAKATKTSNKSGKLSFLTNKINFRSRKIQFLLTILVFALVGGAWFTYKSFASSYTVTYAYPNLTTVSFGQNSSCTAKNTQDPAKNSNMVVGVSCTGANGNSSISVRTPDHKVPINYSNGSWRACAVVKGAGNLQVHVDTGYSGFAEYQQYSNFNSSGYTSICSPWTAYLPAMSRPSQVNMLGYVNINGGQPGIIVVGSITIERQDQGNGNLPTPTK